MPWAAVVEGDRVLPVCVPPKGVRMVILLPKWDCGTAGPAPSAFRGTKWELQRTEPTSWAAQILKTVRRQRYLWK